MSPLLTLAPASRLAHMRSSRIALLLVPVGVIAGFYLGYSRARLEYTLQEKRQATKVTSSSSKVLVGGGETTSPPTDTFASRLARFGAAPLNAAQSDELRRQLQEWAARDPRAALGYVIATFSRQRQEQLVPLILATWAKSDPRGAWAWLSTEEASKLTFPTIADAVLSEASKYQPAIAWELASQAAQQRPYDAQGLYVSALRGMLYTGNFEGAIGMIEQAHFPNGEGRYDLTSLIASDWGRYEPQKAAAWLRGLPEGFERRQALISLGQSWAEVDPQSVADFAADLPPSLERASMLSSAVDKWVTDHPSEVGEWLLRYQQHGDFDQILAAISTNQRVVWQNPPLAISWADTIADSDVRMQALAQIFDHWLTRDDRSAKAFLLKSDQLAPDIRSELRHRLHVDG